MIEASPLIVRKLRHHSFHLTGIRPYDYRTKDASRRQLFEARLAALRDLGGDALLVPESPALGGFGYDIGGRLVNVDTLKFYEVLIGMERGGVLPAMRAIDASGRAPVVCEIGAGWGGFAWQFKTLVPRARYIIVDFAEVFLFSATYLGTLFPAARMAFVGTAQTPTLAAAGDAELVFVPHTRAHEIRARGAGPHREHGVVPGDDRRAGAGLRRPRLGGRLPAALQPEPRAVAVQHRARRRERGARRAVLPDRSVRARHRLHERDEEAAQGGEAGGAVGVQLPAPRRPARPRAGGSRGESRDDQYRDASRHHGGGCLGIDVWRRRPHRRDRHDALQQGASPARSARLAARPDGRGLRPRAPRRRVGRRHRGDCAASTSPAIRACATTATLSVRRWWRPGTRWSRLRRTSFRRRATSRGRAITTAGIRAGSSGSSPRSIGDPCAVLAYPITCRIDEQGTQLDKGPRLFDTSACAEPGRALAPRVP